MVVASYFNKGGVGKTTLATHIAGVLDEEEFSKNLVVDCVDQADAFRFFTGREPRDRLDLVESKNSVSAMWNPDGERVSRVTSEKEYDNIIIDINSPLNEAVRSIVDDPLDKIFVPINDQALALDNLSYTLETISKIENSTGFWMGVIVVPLGSFKKRIEEAIDKALSNGFEIPRDLEISKRVNKQQVKFDNSLTSGRYVWELYEGCTKLRNILSRNL